MQLPLAVASKQVVLVTGHRQVIRVVMCMVSYSPHLRPRGRTTATWNKLERMALMCSRDGAENQGPPNGGVAAGKPQQCEQPQISYNR